MAQDPHVNPASGVWDDNYYATVGKYGGSSGNAFTDQLNANDNKYIDQLISEAGGQRDIIIKKLDAEHKLALGNDDVAKAAFLEKVADGVEQRIGRIPYDYERYTARELEQYAMNKGNIQDNTKLALDKLSMDEKNLGTQTDESLNQRGLLTGQDPNKLEGLAGSEYDRQVTQPVDMERQGINLSNNQQLASEGFRHTNAMQDLTVDTRRGAQDQENATTFGKDAANSDYETKMKALERQRQQLILNNNQIGSKLKGSATGKLGY